MQRRDEFAEEGDAADEIPPGVGDALADIDQEIDEPGVPDWRTSLEAPVGDLVEEDALLRARVHEVGREALSPNSCRVRSSTQAPRVSRRSNRGRSMMTRRRSACRRRCRQHQLFDRGGVLGRPAAGQARPHLVAGVVDRALAVREPTCSAPRPMRFRSRFVLVIPCHPAHKSRFQSLAREGYPCPAA